MSSVRCYLPGLNVPRIRGGKKTLSIFYKESGVFLCPFLNEGAAFN